MQVFSESVLHIRWPKYWSFSFSISPSNEHAGLISFRMDWLDLLAVQGILKSLLQHHSSKASILWCSAFFIVQLSNPYTTTGKTIALTRWTFVGKVMSLLFNMLSRLVWRRKWQHTPVILPGEFHEQRSLAGYSPGLQESGMTEQLSLTRLVITFLPRSKRLLILWLQSPSIVIFEPQKIKSATVSTVSPSISLHCPWTGCHDLSFLNVEL